MQTKTTMLDEVGSLDAAPGTREWAIAVRMELIAALAETTSSGKHLARMLDIFEQYEGWRLLTNKNGQPFASAEEWAHAPQPYGLGRPWNEVKQTVTTRERVQRAETESEQLKRGNRTGNNQHSKREELSNFDNSSQENRAKENGVSRYTQIKLDRLASERPDLLEQVRSGDLSAHAAAIEAGFIKPNSRVAIPMDKPANAAQIIKERMTPEQVQELITHLEGTTDD